MKLNLVAECSCILLE